MLKVVLLAFTSTEAKPVALTCKVAFAEALILKLPFSSATTAEVCPLTFTVA